MSFKYLEMRFYVFDVKELFTPPPFYSVWKTFFLPAFDCNDCTKLGLLSNEVGLGFFSFLSFPTNCIKTLLAVVQTNFRLETEKAMTEEKERAWAIAKITGQI